MKVVTFNFDPEFHKRLKMAAAAEGKTMTEIVLEAVGVYLRDHRKTSPGRTRKDAGASFPPMRPKQS